MKSGLAVFCTWIVTFALGYLGPGAYLAERIEGMDPAMIPLYPSVLFAMALLASLWLTIGWARRIGAEKAAAADGPPKGMGRRRFLTGTAAVTGGVAGAAAASAARLSGWLTVAGPALRTDTVQTDPNPRDTWLGSTVQSYRRLGRTNVEVSDISVGTTQIFRHPDPVGLLKSAMDRGVTYIDTSPDYAGTRAEEAIAKAIKGRRDDLFIATKFCTGDGHVRQGSGVDVYMRAIEESIQRLGTDHVDLVHVHSCDSVARLMDPAAHEAFDRLKEQGKVKYLGVSTHTPNLELVANTAIDSDRFDVMMLAYHHGAWPQQMDIIKRAAQNDVGIVAMKTLKGAKHKGMEAFRGEASSYAQAAFKWVLSNPEVSCLVVSFFESQHVDEYLYASGAPLTTRDIATLEKYDQLIAGTHCFAHCGDCLDACPSGVQINDVLRHRMYFEDYGDQKQAMQLYAKLERKADLCVSCAAPCTGSCPQGIPIHQRVTEAHEMLTLA